VYEDKIFRNNAYIYIKRVSIKVKSFPSHRAHTEAPIFVSLAFSQTSLHCQTTDRGVARNLLRGKDKTGICGTEVLQRGPGAVPR